jgi:AAA domain
VLFVVTSNYEGVTITNSSVGGIRAADASAQADAHTEADRISPAATSLRRRSTSIADIRATPVDWLWQDRVPKGALTVLAGDPGLGKSLLSVSLAAQVSQGQIGGAAADVLLLTAEDSVAHTVRPRLEAAGGDLRRIHVPAFGADGFDQGATLPADVPKLQALIEQHEVGLVVIDPLAAHLAGSINSWKDTEVRQALAPLHKAAEATGAAVLIVAHLNKGQSDQPLQRLGGSVGLPAAARSVLLLARDPGDPDGEQGSLRVLAHVKSNLGQLAVSRSLSIVAERVGTNGEIATARIFEVGDSPYTGTELLSAGGRDKGTSKLAQAVSFLETILINGPVPVTEVWEAAVEDGISEKTLKRAKQRLSVVSRKADWHEGWDWWPADLSPPDPESGTIAVGDAEMANLPL